VLMQARQTKEIGDQTGYPYVAISTTTKDSAPAEDIDRFLTRAEAHQVHVGRTILPPYEGMELNRDCHEVFNKLSINWDGTVSICCRDYDKKMVVGDLQNETIMEIWNGPLVALWQKKITSKDYSHPVCRDCYKYIEREGI